MRIKMEFKKGLVITAKQHQVIQLTLPDGTKVFVKAYPHQQDIRVNIIAPNSIKIKRVDDPRWQ